MEALIFIPVIIFIILAFHMKGKDEAYEPMDNEDIEGYLTGEEDGK